MSLKDNVQLYPTVDRRQCVSCGICKNSCDQRAIDLLGKDYTHDEILRIAERDQSLHRRTGGGITLTGGEPLNQGESLIELISRCRAAGIHTALETCAFAPYELFEAAIKEVQLLFIDLKHMDSIWHKELTGQSNSIILSNLKSASHFACLYKFVLIVRLVLVPGINDGDNLIAAGRFLAKLPHLDGVEILKYHNFGAFKYELFGEQYKMKHVILPTDEDIAYAKELLSSFGFRML
jgi:pyruvate formate lyase activating enzyme